MKHSISELLIINLRTILEKEGCLVALTRGHDEILKFNRLFYAFNVPDGEVRGKHAHKECDQLLVALNGTITVSVQDGVDARKVILDSPSKALFLPAGLWAEEKYMNHAILLALCSQEYDKSDYISNLEEYRTWNEC